MLKAVDFFCGGGGMSLGLKMAGIKILAGIDNNPLVRETFCANHPNSEFILEDITQLSPESLKTKLSLTKEDPNLILVGCSPCQYWSLLNSDKRKSKKTAFLLEYFQSFIEDLKPGYILIENVPGLIKKNESPINQFKSSLVAIGYHLVDGVLNCNDFDVPQNRKRYVLLASQIGPILFPKPSLSTKKTLRDAIGDKTVFHKIPAGHRDISGNFHATTSLSALNLKRLRATPKDGGNRLAWKDDPELQLNAYKGKDNTFRDVYARTWWDRPAPTITTKYTSYSNGRFGHPEQDRALSVREGAALQSFPDNFKIQCKTIGSAAQIIGNAVPPAFAKALGQTIGRSASGFNK